MVQLLCISHKDKDKDNQMITDYLHFTDYSSEGQGEESTSKGSNCSLIRTLIMAGPDYSLISEKLIKHFSTKINKFFSKHFVDSHTNNATLSVQRKLYAESSKFIFQ